MRKSRSKRPKTYYCVECGHEMYPTRDGAYFACPRGCGKLLPEHLCNHFTRAERAEHDKFMEAYRMAGEQAKKLPMCGISHRPKEKSRKHDIWWVEGMEGHFVRIGYGYVEGAVHAMDPTQRYRPAKLVVSLRKLTTEEIQRLIFGAK